MKLSQASVAFYLTLLIGSKAYSAPPLFIKDGTLFTITKGTIQKGSILIKDGKIADIGENLKPPKDAVVVDATGKYVMPGIIDVHSHMGVYAWPGVDANSDGNEMTNPVTAQVRAADAVNIEDPAIWRAIAGGTTTVQILPGSGNLIGGQSVVVKLKPGRSLDDMLFKGAPPGLKMAMGENPKRVYGSRNQSPMTRMGNFFVMRDAFIKAQEYQRKWDDYNKKKEKDKGLPPERDLKLETLSDVMQGKYLVHVHCYRQDEMQRMIDIAHQFGFKIRTFEHSLEAYKVADLLAKEGIAISTWPDWYGFKIEAWYGIPGNAAICAKHGVRVNIHTDSPEKVQRLYVDAAKCVKAGMPKDEALKALTLNPAWSLGIDDRVGSIEKGKDADLAIFSGDPLSIYSLVEKTLIDGEVVFDRSKMTYDGKPLSQK